MAMAGRPAPLPELSGPGTPTLAERITSATIGDHALPRLRKQSGPRRRLRVLFSQPTPRAAPREAP
jgi:hypothetical protein